MKTTYTIFKTDGTAVAGEIDWPEEPGYKLMKALIEPIVGSPMEHVTVLYKDKRADMFVDEMGHIRPEPLPRNEAATAIYRTNWLKQHPDCDPETLPYIAGDAVVFDRRVWF